MAYNNRRVVQDNYEYEVKKLMEQERRAFALQVRREDYSENYFF